jgi:hypothetical protein
MENRSFTVESIHKACKSLGISGGRYISSTPSAAARKAFSQYYRNHKITGRLSMQIQIRETTSGSSQKIFKYNVSKINQERQVVRNGVTITYKYITKVKAI